MKLKSFAKILNLVSLVFVLIGLLCFLFLSILYLKLSETEVEFNEAYFFCFGTIVFIPFVSIITKIVKKKNLNIFKYVKGGLFVIRLIMFAILLLIVKDNSSKIQLDFQKVFHTSSFYEKNILEVETLIKNDHRNELNYRINNLLDDSSNIDYTRLVSFNFKHTLWQTQDDLDKQHKEDVLSKLKERLETLSTVDSLLNVDFCNYSVSSMAKYIPEDEMLDLLADYIKLCINLDYSNLEEIFFNAFIAIDPNSPIPYFIKAETFYKDKNLQKAANWYKIYIEKMRQSGQERAIPKRVIKFIESECYGNSLHKSILESWFNDQPEWIWGCGWEEVELLNRKILGYCGKSFDAMFGIPYESYDEENISSKDISYGLSGCIADKLKIKKVKNDMEPFVKLSGIKPYNDISGAFNYVNPKFIKWAKLNLIPSPDLSISGYSCQTIYYILLKHKIQSIKIAYEVFTYHRNIYREAEEYEQNMYSENFEGGYYLTDRYYGFVDNYRRDEFYFTEFDIGFWLRRVIDGSFEECLDLVDIILDKYDPNFIDYYDKNYHYDNSYEEEEYGEEYEEEYE